MSFNTLFFDLDDTLYPSSTGVWDLIRERMGLYMHERLGIPKEAVYRLRRYFFETYGTTLRGLQKFYAVDNDDYLAFVHDLPLEQYLQPDPEVRSMILSLPRRKWVFTNADKAHAERGLNILNLSDCFDGVIDLYALDFSCKPEKESYLRAMKIARENDPHGCLILDDGPRNLAAAHELGFTTVLVKNYTVFPMEELDGAVDYTIMHLKELREVLPALWEEKEERCRTS